jgi:hypothetical protein
VSSLLADLVLQNLSASGLRFSKLNWIVRSRRILQFGSLGLRGSHCTRRNWTAHASMVGCPVHFGLAAGIRRTIILIPSHGTDLTTSGFSEALGDGRVAAAVDFLMPVVMAG